MVFSKGLLRYWIAFDQPGVLHVGLLVIERFESEKGNHCAALYFLPTSIAKGFFEMGSATGAKSVGIIAHSLAQNSAIAPALRFTQALALCHEFSFSSNPAVI